MMGLLFSDDLLVLLLDLVLDASYLENETVSRRLDIHKLIFVLGRNVTQVSDGPIDF